MSNKLSLHNADIIMSFRGNSQEREDNLYAILEHLDLTFTHYTAWVLEADAAPKFDWKRLSDDKVRYIFVPNTGPFPKAMLYNLGAKMSQSEVLCFNDIDCFTDPQSMSDCVQELIQFQAHDVLCPFWEMINIEGATKKRFLDNPRYELLKGITKDSLTPDTTILYERNAGGIFIFRRKDFIRVGGMDERFIGWGGEDNDLFYRATRLGLRWSSLHTPLYHLNHDSPNRDGWREKSMDNSALGQETEHMPIEQLAQRAEALRRYFSY